jgi:hypothetical protein
MNKNSKSHNAAICALVCSAVALLATVFFVQPSVSHADLVLKDRDYQVVTAKVNVGNDALYILDRNGTLGVFVYEPGRGLVFRGKASVGGQ